MGLRNAHRVLHHENDYKLLDLVFTTANTSAPTGVDPNYGTDLAVARTGVGVFTATFSGLKKPVKFRTLLAQVQGNEPNLFAKAEYNATTGVITIRVFQNAAGTIALADTTSKVVQLFGTYTHDG
jgi:hypothetical protein